MADLTVEYATTFTARRRHLAELNPSKTNAAYRVGESLCYVGVGDQAWINDVWTTGDGPPIIANLPDCMPCVTAASKREADRG